MIRIDLIGIFGVKSSYIIKVFLQDRAALNKTKSFNFSSDWMNGTLSKIIKVKFRIIKITREQKATLKFINNQNIEPKEIISQLNN